MKFAYIVAVTSAFVASPVLAQQGGAPADPLYFGAKGGLVQIDVGGFDDAANFGVYAGYKLYEDPSGAFFAEGEYTRTFNDGDIQNGEWDIETLGAYAGYRTAGPWFLKAKAGFAWRDVNITNIAPGLGVDGSDTGFSFGAGGGFRMNEQTGFEVEYTYLDDDINSLMVGFFTRF